MSVIPGKIDNRLITWEGLNDYHTNLLKIIPKLGYNNTITGQYSFGLGYNNTITGDNSFVAGVNLRAFGSQTIFGQYNKEDENALFIIGNGDNINRQNNFVLSKKSSIIINSSNFIGLYDDINDSYSYSTDIIQASFCSGSNNKIYYFNYENIPHNSVILGGNNNRIASSINSFIIGGKNNLIVSTSSTTGLLGDNLIATSTKKPTLIIGQYNDINANYSNIAFCIGGGSSERDRKNLLTVGYDGELWLGNCYLSSPLYGKEKIELIWPEEGALRHSLFPIQSNEGVWAIHKDLMDDGTIDEDLFINYRQPFEYLEGLASSTSDQYVAPKNIVFNSGSRDSYANLIAETYYNSDRWPAVHGGVYESITFENDGIVVFNQGLYTGEVYSATRDKGNPEGWFRFFILIEENRSEGVGFICPGVNINDHTQILGFDKLNIRYSGNTFNLGKAIIYLYYENDLKILNESLVRNFCCLINLGRLTIG